MKFAASALPATPLMRGSAPPPTSVAVYVVEAASADDGASVAVDDAALYVTVAGTSVAPFRNWKVVLPTVAGSIGSLNVAVTLAVGLTFVAALVGDVAVTVGGVVSDAAPPVLNTTSIQ